jgi:hypothetical protein
VKAFNDYDAVSFIPKNVGGSGAGSIFVFHKPHVLRVMFTYWHDNEKGKFEMTEKILSTFKFKE